MGAGKTTASSEALRREQTGALSYSEDEAFPCQRRELGRGKRFYGGSFGGEALRSLALGKELRTKRFG